MATSILGSISTLLTGTVTEEFKKLFQPASLVAAALLITLNLVLIYPFLVEQRVYFALILQSMGTAAQLGLLTLLILALGYLISSLGPAFLSLVTGNSLRDARLVQATFTKSEKRRVELLQADLGSADEQAQAQAWHKLAFEFPCERERIAPSRLGNVIDSVASYTWHQYGAALDTLWPMMEHVLKQKNPEMQARIEQNRTALTFLASLVVLLPVVFIELAFLRLLWGRPSLIAYILLSLLLFMAAYLVYNAAVRAAMAWSRDVRAAFDLYTGEVETGLALRRLASYELEKAQERRSRLQKVSAWLAHGVVDTSAKPRPEPDWYYPKPEAASPLALTTAPGLKVQPRRQVIEEWPSRRESGHEYRLPGCVVDYLLAISNEQSGEHGHVAGGSFLIAQDSELPALPENVEGELLVSGVGAAGLKPRSIQAQRLPGIPEALVWDLGAIPPQASRVLSYRLSYDLRVGVPPGARIEQVTVAAAPPGPRRVLVTATCTNGPANSLKVTVQVANKEQLSAVAQYVIESGKDDEVFTSYDPASRQGSWTIPDLHQGAKVCTSFWLNPL